ncbi:hypothetical protein B0H13DRAFT_1915018 [Mycena leptocephala]|nr:hypothetical protein B0H13DRAFT_1915018 [Mycena leptocephala]
MEDVQIIAPPVVETPSPNKKAMVNIRPQVFAATLTYPSLESTVLTPFLKFPNLNDVFTPNDIRTWLDGANRKVASCGWRRVLRVARKPRVDYYVEFESAEAALKIRGLIEPREGEIREGYFVGETEFKKVAALSPAVLQQTRNAAETAPASEPYAGGWYLREEPPMTSSLPKTTPVPVVVPSASRFPPPNLVRPQGVKERAPLARTLLPERRPRSLPAGRPRSSPAAGPSYIARLRSPPRSRRSRSPPPFAGPSTLHPRRSRSPPSLSPVRYRNLYLDPLYRRDSRPRSPTHSPWTSRVNSPPRLFPTVLRHSPPRSTSALEEDRRAFARSPSPRQSRSRSRRRDYERRSCSPRRRRDSRSSPRWRPSSGSRAREKRSRRWSRSTSTGSYSCSRFRSSSSERSRSASRRRTRRRKKEKRGARSPPAAPAPSLLTRLGNAEEGEVEEEESPSLLGRVRLDLQARLGDALIPATRAHRRLRKRPLKRNRTSRHGGAL